MLSRKREDVQARHQEIQRLRRKLRFTMKAIAVEVGLKNHTSVWWHLSGLCRCPTDRTFPLLEDEGHAHVFVCTKCGAHG